MDKIIHKHLDNRLDIQEAAGAKVESLFKGLVVKALLKNPNATLAVVAESALGLVEEAGQAAADEGQRFADEVKKRHAQDKPVTFVQSDDPTLNKEKA